MLLHAGGFGLVILDMADVASKDARRIIHRAVGGTDEDVVVWPEGPVHIGSDTPARVLYPGHGAAYAAAELREDKAWSGQQKARR